MLFLKKSNKKGFVEDSVNMVVGVVIALAVAVFLIAALWPNLSDEIVDTRLSYSHDFVLSNTTAEDMVGSNCFTATLSCTNTTGTEAVATGNYTFTVATCSITGADGGDYNNTNITCAYTYTGGSTGNLTAIQTGIPDELNDLVGIFFVVITLIVLLAVYGVYRKYAK